MQLSTSIQKRYVTKPRGMLNLSVYLAEGQVWNEQTFILAFKKNMKDPSREDPIGESKGKWFWQACKRKNSAWRSKIEAIKKAYDASPADQRDIVGSFDHDIDFYEKFTDAHWRFKYEKLSRVLKDAIKTLMVHCYDEKFVPDSYGGEIHGKTGLLINRQYFLSAYRNSNTGMIACPICDGDLGFNNGSFDNCELDHFFPKTIYPFLSQHPYNLIPSCSCNTGKNDTNILMNNPSGTDIPDDALLNIYHSYKNRAISLLGKIEAKRLISPNDAVYINIIDNESLDHRRALSAERVYDFRNRWHGNLYDHFLNWFVTNLEPQEKPDPTRTMTDLLQSLRKERSRCDIEGHKPYESLKIAYLDYAIHNSDEREYLLRRFSGK